jgi:MFS family permease
VALGGLVAGLGSIAFGAAGSLGVASLGRALVGLGVSVTFIALLKLVAAWFREREFATLSGLVMFMGNLGAVLSAAPLAWAVTLTSWRNVFAGIGVSSLAGATLTWLLVRDRPEDAGLPSMRELEGKAAHPPHRGRGGAVAGGEEPGHLAFFVNMGGGTASPSLARAVRSLEAHGMSRGGRPGTPRLCWWLRFLLARHRKALRPDGPGARSCWAGPRLPPLLAPGCRGPPAAVRASRSSR